MNRALPRRTRKPDSARIAAAVGDLIEALGFERDDPALTETPTRAAEALLFMTTGYDQTPKDALGSGYAAHEGSVVATNIPLIFACPHHLTLAKGWAHVAFQPDGRVPGLSRISRLVDVLSRRLVLQEDLTGHIAEALQQELSAPAAVVIIEAQHGCVAIEDFARLNTTYRTAADRGTDVDVARLRTELDSALGSLALKPERPTTPS